MRRLNAIQRLFVNMVVVATILLFGVWIYTSFVNPEQTKAAWFNTNWQYRLTVPVTNTGSDLTNVLIPIATDTASLVTAGKMRSDCRDVRVTTQTGKVLSQWIHQCNTATTRVYVLANKLPAGSSNLYLYYGNSSASQNTEVKTGTTQFPGVSCKTILDHGDSTGDGTYTIDPNAGSPSDAFTATCDMTTDSGGWTIVNSSNGTINQQPLTSNTEVSGDPFSNESSNIANSKKESISTVSAESLFKRSTGVWLKASVPIFDGDLTKANQHKHNTSVTLTANDGTTVSTAVAGYSNYLNSGGGDYGITTSVGFDHHNATTYYHLRSGCTSMYLYRYGSTYNVNTTLGSWTQTIACGNNSTSMGPWYAALRGTNTPLLANITISSPTNEEVSNGPLGYWKFDEGQGTKASDASGNGKNGTITGATWKSGSDCVSGSCLYFDGSADNVSIGSSIAVPNQFTISHWVRTAQATGQMYTVANAGSSNGYRFGLSSGKVAFLIGYGAGYKESTCGTKTVNDNQWHLITGVFDATGTFDCYIDGVHQAQVTFTSVTGFSTSAPGIGAPPCCADYQGYIDDVKIYGYARSAAQVQIDFNSRGSVLGSAVSAGSANSSALSNGLVGYWKYDESSYNGTSGEIADSSGNARNGTSGCTGTSCTDANATSSAKFGNAVGITNDGTHMGYATVSDSGSTDPLRMNGATDMTISSWFNFTNLSAPSSGQNFIVSKYDYSGHFGYALLVNNTGSIRFDINGGANSKFTSTGIVSANQWTHVVAILRGGNTMEIYVNGILVSTFSISSTSISSYTSAFAIGTPSNNVGATQYTSNGYIDETRVYSRALSPSEVQQIYNYTPPPVAYYNFEEGSGTSLNDSSGDGNTGTWSGTGSHWTQGKYGKGGNFNGSDDTISVSDPANGILDFGTGSFTGGAWVKPNTGLASYYSIIEKKSTYNGSNVGWQLWLDYRNNNVITLRVNDGSTANDVTPQSSSVKTTLSDGKWHYVAWVVNIGTNVTFYLDGQNVGTGSLSTMTSSLSNSQPLTIGGHNSYKFPGQIDEVRVYNYARTPGQITQDMNASHPLGGSPVGSQVAYYKFDEGYGTVAHDSGPNKINGTMTGFSSPATPVSGWTNDGKFGKALNYNNSNYVNLGNPSALQFTTGFTISAWINPRLIGAQQGIFSKWYNTTGNRGYRFYLGTTNALGLSLSSDGTATTTVSTPTNTISANQWYYVTAVYDGTTTTASIYVNGVLKSTTSSAPSSIVTNQNANIGTSDAGVSGSNDFQGIIDEVKVYSSPLSANDIKIDYNRGTSLSLGTLGTSSDGKTASNSAGAAYCIPGDTTTCAAPVAEWNFDEHTGATVNDSSGNGNTGNLSGSPTWIQGKIGTGLLFDTTGSDQMNTTGVTIGSNWTLSTWTKFPLSVTGGYRTLVRETSSVHHILVDVNGLLGVYNGAFYSSGFDVDTLSPGWHYLTATGTGGSTTFYIDGKSVGTSAQQITTAIKQVGHAGGAQQWGAIDTMRIYNYARTPAQIAYDYNRGAAIARWKMDECQGSTLHDTMGSSMSADLTIGGSGTQSSVGTCSTSSTAWGNGSSGKFNSAINFDGTDDYALVPDTNALGTTSGYSVSAWVNPTTLNAQVVNYPISKGVGGGAGQGWAFGIDGTYNSGCANAVGKVYLFTNNTFVCSSNTISTGTWSHIVFTNDGTTTKIYINGILRGSGTQTMQSNAAVRLNLGRRSDASWYYKGLLDEVQVFNYALTQSQVQNIMNQNSSIRFGPASGTP